MYLLVSMISVLYIHTVHFNQIMKIHAWWINHFYVKGMWSFDRFERPRIHTSRLTLITIYREQNVQVCIYWEYRWITINLHCFENMYLCHQNMTFVNRSVIFCIHAVHKQCSPPMSLWNGWMHTTRTSEWWLMCCFHSVDTGPPHWQSLRRTYTHSVIVTRRTLMGALYRHLYTNYIHTQLLCTTKYCTICDILHDHMQLVGQSHNALANPTCRRIVIFLL